MHIESIIIDGFKSYCNRTVVGPLDPHFNAITGLNGSGKSNVLDSLCFVMGISDLTRMRATKLDDLIYKQGQAGVTKATVTLIFNNKSASSPLPEPYKKMPELTITRQIAMGGRNRYFLNGHQVSPKSISDFFQMAKMNVNNPRFLIMQGKITSVVNMSPKELLTLLEEAAGTRLYESKKAAAIKLMARKDSKLEDINRVLKEEIEPAIEKLKKERDDLIMLTNTEEELERLTRYNVAYTYYKANESKIALENKKISLKDDVELFKQQLEELSNKANEIKAQMDEKNKEMASSSTNLSKIQGEKDVLEKERGKINNEIKLLQQDILETETSIADLKKESGKLKSKLDEINKNTSGDDLKLAAANESLSSNKKLLADLESDLNDLNGGIKLVQLKSLKTQLSELESSESKAKQTLNHYHTENAETTKQISQLGNENHDLDSNLEKIEKEIFQLESQLNTDLGDLDDVEKRIASLSNEKSKLEVDITNIECKITSYCINVNVPHDFKNTRDLNYDAYLGQAFELFGLKDEFIDTCGIPSQSLYGSKLNYLIVSNKRAAKRIFDQNNFKHSKRKITVLPLKDSVVRKPLIESDVDCCRRIVGVTADSNAVLGYKDYLNFDPELEKLVQYVAGGALICSTSEYARKISYGNSTFNCSTVTFDGDRFDLHGNMSGGSNKGLTSLLAHKSRFDSLRAQLHDVEKELDQLRSMKSGLDKDKSTRNQIQLLKSKQSNLKQQIASSKLSLKKNYLSEVEAKISKLSEEIKEFESLKADLSSQIDKIAEDIEEWERDKAGKDQELREKIKNLKNKIKDESAEINKLMQLNNNDAQIEKQTLQMRLEKANEDCESKESLKADLNTKLKSLQLNLENKEMELKLKTEEFVTISGENTSYHQYTKEMNGKLKKVESDIQKINMDLLKSQHEITNADEEHKKITKEIKLILEANSWIPLVEDTFNKPNTQFNFSTLRPEAVKKRLQEIREKHMTLGKHVNKNAVQIFEKTNALFSDLLRKKEQVLNDKAKIQEVIENLDKAKMESLSKLYNVVNSYFSSIFHTLLPNADAKLDLMNNNLINGIEMKIGFNNVWKNSLSELSGGQRSLLALSLVLALLKCRPAPVYILDEIDSALDLSHTQNIGQMIKTHFSYSQFIIVSLKQNMFNNANVLFQASFVNGASSITRKVQQ